MLSQTSLAISGAGPKLGRSTAGWGVGLGSDVGVFGGVSVGIVAVACASVGAAVRSLGLPVAAVGWATSAAGSELAAQAAEKRTIARKAVDLNGAENDIANYIS